MSSGLLSHLQIFKQPHKRNWDDATYFGLKRFSVVAIKLRICRALRQLPSAAPALSIPFFLGRKPLLVRLGLGVTLPSAVERK
jgi:hypothetical protein